MLKYHIQRRFLLCQHTSDRGRRRGSRKMEVHRMVEPCFHHVCISTVMGLLVLASLEGSAEGAAVDSGRLTIRQYYYCLGGDLEGFACQGLTDRTTCGTGGTCVEDLYVDACGNGYRMQLEECDDGNEFAADGCSDTCSVDLGWQCSGASEREPDKCSVVCGDGRQLDAGCCDSFVEADACSRESFSPCLCSRTRVSAASEHTCAIDSDTKILCWGDNSYNKTAKYFERTKGARIRGRWGAGRSRTCLCPSQRAGSTTALPSLATKFSAGAGLAQSSPATTASSCPLLQIGSTTRGGGSSGVRFQWASRTRAGGSRRAALLFKALLRLY